MLWQRSRRPEGRPAPAGRISDANSRSLTTNRISPGARPRPATDLAAMAEAAVGDRAERFSTGDEVPYRWRLRPPAVAPTSAGTVGP